MKFKKRSAEAILGGNVLSSSTEYL